ncbi:hypothetical protein AB0M02_39415 [Actinoplanes sp. NPDC051861]|uniref:hypothetical protein n=1 Tax=Actinoplanes sp. NPDC051861 TaxID=3155170 RepID=UPI00342261AA
MLTHDQAVDFVRRYDGVPPEILADGTWMLTRRAFWLSLVDGSAEPDLVGALFDGEDDDLEAFDDQIRSSGRWPVVNLGPLAVVLWHGYEFEGGYDFVVLPPGTDRCVSIAAVEGHGHGPGLSWPEVQRLVTHATVATPEQRLLLLLPALGDAETPDSAIDQVAAALLTVGNTDCPPKLAEEAARQILEDTAHWTTTHNTVTCDAEYAVRRPGGLSPSDLLLVTQALS